MAPLVQSGEKYEAKGFPVFHCQSVIVFLSQSCSFFLSEQLLDVTQRQAGLSHITTAFKCDTMGLEGTEMVLSVSTCIIPALVQSTDTANEVMRGPVIPSGDIFFPPSSASLCLMAFSTDPAISCSFYLNLKLETR